MVLLSLQPRSARGPLSIAFPLVEKSPLRKSAKSANKNPSRRVNLRLHLLGALSIWWWANFHGRSLCEWSWAPCRTRKTIRYCPGTDGGDPLHRRDWRRWRKTSRQGSPGLGSRSNSSKASSSKLGVSVHFLSYLSTEGCLLCCADPSMERKIRLRFCRLFVLMPQKSGSKFSCVDRSQIEKKISRKLRSFVV